MEELLVFRLDSLSIGLRASTVDRIVYAVEITPLPRAPDIAMGVIDVHGTIVPVVNLRKRLGLPPRPLALNHRFVIARTAGRSLALVADAVDGVFDYADCKITEPASLLPGVEQVTGIINGADGIIFIHDLDQFLSLSEARSLDGALAVASISSNPGGVDAS